MAGGLKNTETEELSNDLYDLIINLWSAPKKEPSPAQQLKQLQLMKELIEETVEDAYTLGYSNGIKQLKL